MRNSWKKTAAFVLALTLVAAPLTQTAGKGGLFGGSAITAKAAEYSEGDDASIFSISVGDTFDVGSTITRNNSAGVLQEIYVDDYLVFKYYGPGTYTVNENLTLTAVDGVKYYFDSTDTNDLTNATVTVDVAAKSTTVKIGDKNVGPAKYDVKYGSTLENATADFPTQAGSYYAFVTAKETAGNYIGQAKSEAFTVSAEGAVTWTDISANKSQDGISITSSGVDFTSNYISGYNGSITFTSTAGKIKKIEISCNDQRNMNVFETSSGWNECFGDGPLVWNGTAADSVTLSARTIDIMDFSQAVFTLEAKSDISDTTVTVDTENQAVSVTRGNAFIPEDEYEVTYGTSAETATADFPTGSGNYYAFVTAKADSTYYTGTAQSEAFTVVNTITLNSENITIADFTYDGTEKTPVLKYGDTVLVKDKDYEFVTTEGDTASATNAGTYTIHINGKGDYAGENVLLMWNISKADPTVTAPTVKTGLTYTGSAQALAEAGTTTGGTMQYGVQVTPTVYKADGEAIDVNVANLNAGDVLQVTRDNSSRINFIGGTVKYRNSEGNLKSENIDYINYGYWSSIPPYHFINLRYSGGGHMLNNVDYNALIVTSKADDTITIEPYNYNASEMTTAWSDTVPEETDAGIYQLMYRVVGDNNYNSFGDVSGCLFGASEIAKADVSVTAAEGLTYNGNPQNLISGDVPAGTKFTLTPPQEPDYETEKTKISGWISALNDKANNASSSEEGDYYYSAASALSYYYSVLNYLNRNYESNPVNVMSEAVRSAGEMAQGVTPSDDVKEAIDYINTYIKDKTLDDVKARFATVEPDDWSDTITATNAGDYTVYYKGSGNYDDTVKSVTAHIEWARPDVKSPTGLTAKYGQTLADVKIPPAENGIFSWNLPATTSVGDVGYNSFDASFYPIDTENYTPIYHCSLTVNVTAIPANPTAVGTLNATYGKTLADVALPTADDGTWAWKDAATNPSVGNAGEQTFTAVFTPSSANYTAVEQDVTINVAKADPTPTDTSGLSATYGATLADVKLPTGWAWKDDTLSVGDVGKKTFGATYTPADTNNYNVIEGGVQINVVAVDKTALNEAVTAANTYLATIQKTVYADPALALISAINDAKSVAENDNVTEAQVAQAITDVNNAVTTAKAAVKEIDDTLAAKAVTDMINALPAVEDIKSSDKEDVDAARDAYTKLTEAQKAKVAKASTDKLAAAEKEVADHIAADAVIEKINAIGTVALTDESKALIDAARAAYDALMTEAQKALVSNYPALTAAEQEYSNLNLQVADVEAKINAIGNIELTDAIKEKIDTARTAYDALSPDQQALVRNAVALGYAEKLYEALDAKDKADKDKAAAEKSAAEALDKATKAETDKAAAETEAAKALDNAAKAAEAQAKAEAEAAAAKTAQANAEKAQAAAETALANAEKDASAKVAAAQAAQKTAETAQATAEKAAADAKTAQTKAEEEAAAAKTAQANAEKAKEAAETALANAEKDAADKVAAAQAAQKTAETAQATAEKAAADAKTAQTKAEEEAAAAKTAQANAEKAKEAAETALANAEKDVAAKVAAAQAAQKTAETAQATAEKAAADAKTAQTKAEEEAAAAKTAQANAEKAKEAAETALANAEKDAADKVAAAQAAQKTAETAQATAEKAAADAKIAQTKAEEEAAAAKTAQADAEKAQAAAETALANAEKDAADKVAAAQAAQKAAETAQATAEKAAADAKTAQTKAEEEAAAAKTAQANAEKAKEDAETAQSNAEKAQAAAETALANAEKDAADKVAAAQAAQKTAETAQATAEKAAADAKTAQTKAEEEAAAAKTAQADAEKAQAAAEEAQKEAVEARSAAEALAKQAEAEKEAAEKKAAEEKAAADKAAADKVIEKINEIGKVNNSNASENKIIAARAAYDMLTDDQKALVSNYDILTKSESDYDALPQTGMSGFHKVFAGLAALMGIAGFGLVKKSRKEDDDE